MVAVKHLAKPVAGLALLFCIWGTLVVPSGADDSGVMCNAAQAGAAAMNQVMGGKSISAGVVFKTIAVDCSKKTVMLGEALPVADKDQPSFSPQVIQVVLNSTICKSVVWRDFVDKGWTITSNFTFSDGVQRSFGTDCAGKAEPSAPIAAASGGTSGTAIPPGNILPPSSSQNLASLPGVVVENTPGNGSGVAVQSSAGQASSNGTGTLASAVGPSGAMPAKTAAVTAAASTPPVITAVEIMPGDRWIYRIVDDITGNTVATESLVVTEKQGDTVTVATTTLGAGAQPQRSGIVVFNDTWDMINNGVRFQPANPSTGIALPLTTTSNWTTKYSMSAPNRPMFRGTAKTRVLGWEHITLDTGLDYYAYKIETTEVAGPPGAAPTLADKVDLWYAPAANRFVKRIDESRVRGRLASRIVQELVAYTRKAGQ